MIARVWVTKCVVRGEGERVWVTKCVARVQVKEWVTKCVARVQVRVRG